jgi:hypothetical protein
MRFTTLFCCVLLAAGGAVGESFADPAETALRKALDAMATRQTHGGWGRAYTLHGGIMWGEFKPIPNTWITVQPPATPRVAQVYLRAGQVLDDPAYIEHARRARVALLALQTPEGGFPHEADPAGQKATRGTFDDDTTTSVLAFFIDWWQHTRAAEDLAEVHGVGDFLLTAQYPEIGGWPQAYPPPAAAYQRYITFNDNNIELILRALLQLHEITGETRYLDAAKRGGECILRLQGGPGEAIWAQQYDPESLEPAWARKFEPPGYSAAESIGVCNILIELYLTTGEDRFLEPLPKAFEWYDTHQLPDGKWARLYEPGTQRPVYGRRDIAEKVYDREKATTGYSWEGNWYPHAAKSAYERIREIGREAYLEELKPKTVKADLAALEARAREATEALSEDGWWLSKPSASDLEEYQRAGVPEDEPMVELRLFNRNAGILLDYLEALKTN